MNSYRLFGLAIQSCVDLHAPAIASGDHDLEIAYGTVPSQLSVVHHEGVRFQSGPRTLLLRIDKVARYLAEDGRRILIDRDPRGADDQVALFLNGPVLGAALHQRGDLVLHASVVAVDGRAVAFLGRSGS